MLNINMTTFKAEVMKGRKAGTLKTGQEQLGTVCRAKVNVVDKSIGQGGAGPAAYGRAEAATGARKFSEIRRIEAQNWRVLHISSLCKCGS